MPMTLFLAFLAIYAAVGVLLYALQDILIFPRRVNAIPRPDEGAAVAPEHLSLAAPDGTLLNGLMLASPRPAAPLLLAFGGNAHDATGMVRFLFDTLGGAVTVAGFSYRGYTNALGRPSGGKPSEKLLKQDALFIHDTLTSRLQPGRTVAIGYSLGTAMATHVAVRRAVDGLILVAPFASIARLAQRRYKVYPARLMLRHPFLTEREINRVKAPVTILYSEGDGLIHPSHVRLLRKAAPGASVVALDPPPPHIEVLNHPMVPSLLKKAMGL